MRYLPKSDSERKEMLDAIGVASVENLFETIPSKFRLDKPLPLPGPMSEPEIIRYFQDRAAETTLGSVGCSDLRSVTHLLKQPDGRERSVPGWGFDCGRHESAMPLHRPFGALD